MAALEKFSALSPMGKVSVLTGLVHAETVHARGAYDRPDQQDALRRSNEMVHRIAGYVSAILDGRTSPEQDASVLQMLADAPHLAGVLDTLLTRQARR